MTELSNILQSVVHCAILDLTRKLADAQQDIDVSSDMSANDIINALNVSHKHMLKILQQYIRVLDLADWVAAGNQSMRGKSTRTYAK